MGLSLNVFGDHAHPIVHDLKKSALNQESARALTPANAKPPLSEQGHERSVIRQYSDFAVERGRDDRVRVAVEHSRFRRDDRDLHHELASFLDFSTASSMPPTM